MDRVFNHRTIASKKWDVNALCPSIQRRLKKVKVKAGESIAKYSNAKKFQVTTIHGEQFCVNLAEHTCNCRKWNLSRIPCSHSIAGVYYDGTELEHDVPHVYRVGTFLKVYEHNINPIGSFEYWDETNMPPLEPPTMEKPARRPQRARK